MYKNKVCVKVNCYKGFNYDQTFDGIKNAGFKYVELSTSKGNSANISQDLPISKLWEIKEDLNSRGLIPIALGGNSYIMDEDTSKLLSNIYLANFFNCQYVDTVMFDARNDAESKAEEKEIIQHLNFYLPYLEKFNLDLVIELHGKYATGDIVNHILNQVNSKHVHINYDTGNALYWGKLEVNEMLEDLQRNVNNVSYFHLKDVLVRNGVYTFPATGSGIIPFRKVFDILKDNNNQSFIAVEIEYFDHVVNDVKEVDQDLLDSSKYLKSLGIEL